MHIGGIVLWMHEEGQGYKGYPYRNRADNRGRGDTVDQSEARMENGNKDHI